MSKQTIWNYLKTHTELSDIGIAGIMGNLEAESNCEACRLQGDFSKTRQQSRNYADMVNRGVMSVDKYMTDNLGWGLAQWTFYSRKHDLYKTCQSYGKGIEDESAQLAFMLAEMQTQYPTMWHSLLTVSDLKTAAYLVCHNYEKPAVENVNVRASFAQEIYNQFHNSQVDPPAGGDADLREQIIEFLEAEIQRIQIKINELKSKGNY